MSRTGPILPAMAEKIKPALFSNIESEDRRLSVNRMAPVHRPGSHGAGYPAPVFDIRRYRSHYIAAKQEAYHRTDSIATEWARSGIRGQKKAEGKTNACQFYVKQFN